MIVSEVVRENLPFIFIGIAGGVAWAVVVFTILRSSRPPRKKGG